MAKRDAWLHRHPDGEYHLRQQSGRYIVELMEGKRIVSTIASTPEDALASAVQFEEQNGR